MAATANAISLPREALQTHSSPPRMPLTTDALFENQMWERLVGAGASSVPDTWIRTKGQKCVSAFQTQLNLEIQHALDHQDQVGVYESKEKRTFEIHTRTEDSEVNGSSTGESSDTCSIYLKFRQSYVTANTRNKGERAFPSKAGANMGETAGKKTLVVLDDYSHEHHS